MNSLRIRLLAIAGAHALFLMSSFAVSAQHIRGALRGTVSDPTGAVISEARVILRNSNTGLTIIATSNKLGNFSFQNLEPGEYHLTVEKEGFRKFVAQSFTVNVGGVTSLVAVLEVGETREVIEVRAGSDVAIDSSRPTIDGVITTRFINNLPLNGRNFLDLTQLEPGVQVRDGGEFDPTKNQFAGVSIGGRSGRSTRIQIDGVDITDETVGTTTANISNETIREFQVSRSMLDASADLTSSGAVNIVTRSGSNEIHGSGFAFFRDERFASDLRLNKTLPTTEKPPFDRQQAGGSVGGFFMRNKLFWHAEYEHNNQDGQQFTDAPNFPQFTNTFAVPLDEHIGGARLDWHLRQSLKAFYRFGQNYNSGVTGFGGGLLSAFANLNNTNTHVAGLDLTTSRWTHSGRFSYLNFNNFIVDANQAAGTPTTLDPAGKPVTVFISGQLGVGPSPLAPQVTFQDNKQAKYDASIVAGNHILRFGSSYNKIAEVAIFKFFGLAPRIRSSRTASTIEFADSKGGAGDPLNYPLQQIILGNGLGALSERPALGFDKGGTINHRLGFYFTDAWKIRRHLTFSFGVRYSYDSGLSNSDLKRTPKLAEFNPALGGFVNNDANNIAPQIGFAWNLKGNGKTVIRAGSGLFYDTNIINNFLFDRVINLPPGLGNISAVLTGSNPDLLDPATGNCLFRATNFNATPGQCSAAGGINLFNQPLKNTLAAAQQMQQVYQQVSAELAAKYPPPGVPPLFDQILSTRGSLIFNQYKRPYGIMLNVGVQREIISGLVLSVDYLRNRGVHFNQVTDLNRIGAADTVNVAMARAAIAATNSEFGCPASSSPSATNCAINNGATIADYASFGLGRGSALDGFAFQGVNPNFRNMGVIQPIGLSTYDALSVNLRGQMGNQGPFKNITANLSYALSRFRATGEDADANSGSVFNDRPTKFFGPAGLDRTHQFSLGLLAELPWGFKISSITRVSSALAQSVFLPCNDCGAAEIFFTNLDGDGTISDPLPGTRRGSFGREVRNGKALNKLIATFNAGVTAGMLTPAGRALVSAGLFTESQLKAIGATMNGGIPVDLAPDDQVGLDSFINIDMRLSWVITLKERVSIQPMVEVFNLFNIANYDPPGNPLNGFLDASAGSINGTTQENRSNRYGLGSGSFAPGIPRAFQFGIRVNF